MRPAIEQAEFEQAERDLAAWLAGRVPAEVDEAALRKLLADPAFALALAQRQFIAKPRKIWFFAPFQRGVAMQSFGIAPVAN